MAVFTPVTAADLAPLLARMSIGEFRALKDIEGGIENSNFFLSTSQGEFVLTLFERLSFEQAPFYLELMKHLARHDLPVPEPLTDHDGRMLLTLNDKPTCIVSRLQGAPQLQPQAVHCQQAGSMLARLHLAVQSFTGQQPNLRGLAWWRQTAPLIQPFLSAEQNQLLSQTLAEQEQFALSPSYAKLPRGAVHADLFRDNAMFDGNRLSGVFDFYFAGVDTFLFDFAVTLNDWCVDHQSGAIDLPRANAMLQGYVQIRPFTAEEQDSLAIMLRAAALRFWISRVWDFYLPRKASLLKAHDPTPMERILRLRTNQPMHYSQLSSPLYVAS